MRIIDFFEITSLSKTKIQDALDDLTLQINMYIINDDFNIISINTEVISKYGKLITIDPEVYETLFVIRAIIFYER